LTVRCAVVKSYALLVSTNYVGLNIFYCISIQKDWAYVVS
jgi:hypothetical protein